MTVTNCPICETQGVTFARASNDSISIHCPICMRFEITGTAEATISTWELNTRLLLAGRVRLHWAETHRPMRLTSDVLNVIDTPRFNTVLDKQNALLFDIASRTPHPGAVVAMQSMDRVVVDSVSGDELVYHLASLIDRGFLQQRPTVFEATLTSQGWAHIEALRSSGEVNKSDIFVAMSFGETLRPAWDQGIKPGIAAAGYIPKRVDSVLHNDKIDDRIIAGIRGSYALVVDVTTQNAGAYFEAGFAMGLGRPVVWTVRADDLPNLHFDTRQFLHIVWSAPEDLSAKLTTHLLAVFGRGPA